jgi:exopolyphosphatase/guanosine-5'-triphosphate,3'-diphosphate pyrophosphatase
VKAQWAEHGLRLAIIDLGTNSVRFDAYALLKGGRPERLHREKRMLRLGEGLYGKGKLAPKAEARLHAALHDFSRMISDWGVEEVWACATSALRELNAETRKKLLSEIRRRHGIRLRVISGRREAELIAEGILENERLPKGNFALIDIGGGSTELSFCQGRRRLKSLSLKLGALRLQQLCLRAQPPGSVELLALRALLRESLPKTLPQVSHVIGSSGTIRCLARLAAHAGKRFNPAFLRELNARMAGLDRRGLLRIPGMEVKRVDLILAGSLLFEELVTHLGARTLSASSYSLRDGALSEILASLKARQVL